jgi:regulator of sirC expression with transglutaminase-like and TPR domain
VELKEYRRAIEDCSRSLHNSSEFWQDFVNRGSAYAMLGEYHRAIEDYRTAIRHGGTHDQLRRVIAAVQKEAERSAVAHVGRTVTKPDRNR